MSFQDALAALAPDVWLDFEGVLVDGMEASAPANVGAPYTLWCGDNPPSETGPLGQALYYPDGWWAYCDPGTTGGDFPTLLSQGMTFVKVWKPGDAAGYTELYFYAAPPSGQQPPSPAHGELHRFSLDFYRDGVSRASTVDFRGVVELWNTNGEPWSQVSYVTSGGGWQEVETPWFADGEYHVYVATVSPLSDGEMEVKLYVDGVLEFTSTLVDERFPVPSDPVLSSLPVGGFGPDCNTGSGGLDDEAFFSRALSPSEIATLTLLPGGVPPPPDFWINFVDARGGV